MDDIRSSLSKMKKKFKHRVGLTGRKRKSDGTRANPGEEGADSTSSLPQSEPHAVVGESYDGQGDKANAAGKRVIPTYRAQPEGPESVPARGSDNSREGGEADIDEGEASQRHSHLHPDVEVAVESGRSGELEGVYPSPSTPSIPHGGKPGGTWIWLLLSIPLVILSDNVGTSAFPDHGPDVRSDENLDPSAVADETKLNYGPTASATAGLLHEARDSAGSFGPLKSIARSLCFVLDNYEVWTPSRTSCLQCSMLTVVLADGGE